MRVKVLLMCLFTLATFACRGAEGVEETLTPGIPLEEPATATKVILPSPTLRASATPTIIPTATITPTPTIAVTITPERVTKVEITIGAANLRLGAGTEFAVVGVIAAGEDIILLNTNLDGSWYKVRTAEGIEGWVGSTVARLVEGEAPPELTSGTATATVEETATAAAED
jgi:hypothetical protein